MKFMPEGIVAYDHAETVNAFAQGDVAMITEWSAFYSTVVSPETSKVADCVEIAPEPTGPAGRKPALAASRSPSPPRQTRPNRPPVGFFIQWVTSAANAGKYLEMGGVPARKSAYADPALAEKFKFIPGAGGKLAGSVPESVRAFAEWLRSPRSCRNGAPR